MFCLIRVGGSSSGRTTGSGPVCEGSIPSPPANFKVKREKRKVKQLNLSRKSFTLFTLLFTLFLMWSYRLEA
jgi:hypothetical protein